MIEILQHQSRDPANDLTRYRYHTGASPRPLQVGEACPVLFRDIGPVAMARFLRGELRRLAGPLTPITYMRTEAYSEPYTDHERIGRLVFLRPLLLRPWHSGVPSIYVARATRLCVPSTIAFVPGAIPLAEAARLAADLADGEQWREVMGGYCYNDARAETLHRLDELAVDLAETEQLAEPVRRALQSADRDVKEQTREAMHRRGISEDDLCAAWHHLPRERRDLLRETLVALTGDRSPKC